MPQRRHIETPVVRPVLFSGARVSIFNLSVREITQARVKELLERKVGA
jgi:hypothetical protein